MGTKATKTLKVRIKDKHAAQLREWARSVNFVWNYINELSTRSIRERGKFLSKFDLQKYTDGSGKLIGLHSQTVQGIADEYATRRKQFKKRTLSWRRSGGARRSLGWVPFKSGAAVWKNGQVVFNKHHFKVWDSCGLAGYQFRSGSFNEDARGRWYFNVVVEAERKLSPGRDEIGIDLGLKTTATCSDGDKLESGRFYHDLEQKLGVAQRAGRKARVRAIHAKIANRRKDALHKFSNALVARCCTIYVGDVSPLKLAKTKMGKSTLDAGWGMLKTMLEYKCDHAGIVFKVIGEAYTTQTCSSCGSLPVSRPRGIAGLGIREWTCVDCGEVHDRDINAARNILAAGHGRPVVGIPHHS
ncbi:RNA-guided endonuclease InsQ/TnpB family protein [Pseudomonas aeruginosa]